MELREWLPLVVSGVLGLAGIIAGLWGTLANVRVQRDRDKRDAQARDAAAKRDAEAARRAHLLDERRSAYADLIAATLTWMSVIRRRVDLTTPGDEPRVPQQDDVTVKTTRDAAALVQLLAPSDVGAVASTTLSALTLADMDSRAYAYDKRDQPAVWQAIRDMEEAVSHLIKTLNADLVPSTVNEASSQD